MALHRNREVPFERKIKTIAASGVPIPGEVTALQKRLADFARGPKRTAARDALAKAVIDGDTDTVGLWAAAIAEVLAKPSAIADVVQPVRQRVNAEIRAVYAMHADDVYSELAARYDAAAAALHGAAEQVNVDADTIDAVLNLPAKSQRAWRDAKSHVEALNALLPPLTAAAELAGLIDADSEPLALFARLDGVDPAAAWDAWTIEHRQELAERQAKTNSPFTTYVPAPRTRCGRWSALIAAGATLRAATREDYVPFSKPKPPNPAAVEPILTKIPSPRIRVRS